MNKMISSLVLSLAIIALSIPAEAGIVLSKGDKCFQLGQSSPGSMRKTLKIHTNYALTDRFGDLVQVSALEHGFQATNPPIVFTTPMVGTGTFITDGSPQSTVGKTQISLMGTHFGTNEGRDGLWVDDYSVSLNRQNRGKVDGGFLVGFTEFAPLEGATGVVNDKTTDNVQLVSISCKDF